MRAREFIVEAKPENLGQGMLDKMYAAWLYRDANEMGAIDPKYLYYKMMDIYNTGNNIRMAH